MKKLLFIITLFLVASASFAQKEAYNWLFSEGGGMTWNTTQTKNGMTGLPTPLTGSAMTNQAEGVFCMSDASGRLLFHSNGMTVRNRNNQPMINGSNLSGDASSAQSGIIIPYVSVSFLTAASFFS